MLTKIKTIRITVQNSINLNEFYFNPRINFINF